MEGMVVTEGLTDKETREGEEEVMQSREEYSRQKERKCKGPVAESCLVFSKSHGNKGVVRKHVAERREPGEQEVVARNSWWPLEGLWV